MTTAGEHGEGVSEAAIQTGDDPAKSSRPPWRCHHVPPGAATFGAAFSDPAAALGVSFWHQA